MWALGRLLRTAEGDSGLERLLDDMATYAPSRPDLPLDADDELIWQGVEEMLGRRPSLTPRRSLRRLSLTSRKTTSPDWTPSTERRWGQTSSRGRVGGPSATRAPECRCRSFRCSMRPTVWRRYLGRSRRRSPTTVGFVWAGRSSVAVNAGDHRSRTYARDRTNGRSVSDSDPPGQRDIDARPLPLTGRRPLHEPGHVGLARAAIRGSSVRREFEVQVRPGSARGRTLFLLASPRSPPSDATNMRPRRRGEGMKRAETPCSSSATLGPKTRPFAGKTMRNAANPEKRTTGLEPATFGLGSRRSTN
jgi:hypothetical protein